MFAYCPILPLHVNLKCQPNKNIHDWWWYSRFLRSKIEHITVNSKRYSKRFCPVNQSPRGYCMMKKTEGQKSHDIVSLIGMYELTSNIYYPTKLFWVLCFRTYIILKKIHKSFKLFPVCFGCFLFVSVQSKQRNSRFRYLTETIETNVLFRIVSKPVSVPVSVVSNRN
jgi:hypothetical protein